ncbi:Z-ring formation inhibitor MciZ [Alkalihalobacillus urbisdiaboli]|uniref:Z-ring formation inhibitor MciZ n=1 Tax=Halalkalibacter urbisdiaboli TaxID=1960589 RepID=UPI000B43DF99
MKIYVHQKGIILAGKAWEIKAKLKEAMRSYHHVEDWSNSIYQTSSRQTRTASATAKKNVASSAYPLPIVRIGKGDS